MTPAQPEILSPEDSALWRQLYLEVFIETDSEHYQRTIAPLRTFSDGEHYTGYLWDCLRGPAIITFERFRHEVVRYPEVLVTADNHSGDRIMGVPLWPYRGNSVARFTPPALLEPLDSLPEDIYVFDDSVAWTLVLTHEHNERRRICLAAGFDPREQG